MGRGNNLNQLKIQKQYKENNIVKSIRNLFKLKTEKETIEDRIIRDIRTHFEQEDDYALNIDQM